MSGAHQSERMHRSAAALLAIVVVLAAVCSVSGTAHAASDSTAPQLLGFSVSPATVDTGSAAVSITVSAHVSDDLSGTSEVDVFVTGPGGVSHIGTLNPSHLVSGTVLDGQFQSTISLPRYSPSGTWTIAVATNDVAGNRASWNTGQLAAAGFTSTLQVVDLAASVTTLESSTNPSRLGQSVTFNASVSGVGSPSGTPTGSVAFSDGPAILGVVPLSNGSASLTTSALTAGPHAIVASYLSDATFAASASSSLTQTVNAGTTRQKITFTSVRPTHALVGGTYAPSATSTSGLSVTLTIAPASASVCALSPAGLVTFTGAGTCTILANQPGSSTYAPAPRVQQAITVRSAP
jgi:hypothetical protein